MRAVVSVAVNQLMARTGSREVAQGIQGRIARSSVASNGSNNGRLHSRVAILSWSRGRCFVNFPRVAIRNHGISRIAGSHAASRLYHQPKPTLQELRDLGDCLKAMESLEKEAKNSNRIPHRVLYCINLFDVVARSLQSHPEWLSSTDVNDRPHGSPSLRYWCDGRRPRATHLLNAILDQWRIVLTSEAKLDPRSSALPWQGRFSSLPNPVEMWHLLEEWSRRPVETETPVQLPLDSRTYTLVMNAANVLYGARTKRNNHNTAQTRKGDNRKATSNKILTPQSLPLFCQSILIHLWSAQAFQSLAPQQRLPSHLTAEDSLWPRLLDGPDVFLVTTVFRSWSLSSRNDIAQQVTRLWQAIVHCYPYLRPQWQDALPEEGVAPAWLPRLDGHHDARGRSDFEPNVVLCNTVLDALLQSHAISLEQQAANAMLADRFLYAMTTSGSANIHPNMVSYRTVLLGWVHFLTKRNQETQLPRPTQTRRRGDALPDRHVALVEPNPALRRQRKVSNSFHETQPSHDVSAQSADPLALASVPVLAFQRVRDYLDDMIRLYKCGSSSVELDADFFAVILSTLARYGVTTAEGRGATMSAYQQADDVFNTLLDLYQETQDPRFCPNEHVWRAMLIVKAKQGRADEARAILDTLIAESAAAGSRSEAPNLSHFKDLLTSFVLKAQSDGYQLSSIEAAESVLLTMIKLGRTKDERLLPEHRTVDTILHMWSKSDHPTAPERADQLIRFVSDADRSIGAREDTRSRLLSPSSFALAMKCWTRHTRRDSGTERAEMLLLELNALYKSGDHFLRPDANHFTCVISAAARAKDLNRAHSVFALACGEYESGNEKARPNAAMYHAIITAHANAGDASGAERLLCKMHEDFNKGNWRARPTSHVFNLVLETKRRSVDADSKP
jgi:pentatricopeptide repeat protein